MNMTIGCDPELFLFDNLLQRIVPAVGKIGGTKQKPLQLTKGTVQLDGTVVEIGTHPASSPQEFVDNLQSVISEVQTKLDNRFHGRYSLRCGALAGYSAQDISPNHIGFDVGCEPQYSFEDENTLVKVEGQDKLDINAIPVGGHIHVGFGCNLPITDKRLVVSVARYVEKLWSRMVQTSTASTAQRNVLMNAHKPIIRIKPYGFELRNLDSYWLADKGLAASMFSLLGTTATLLSSGNGSRIAMPYQVNKYLAISSAAKALPAKYQETLPLDF